MRARLVGKRVGRRRGAGDERGAVIAIVALSMTMILAATALSFDIGRQIDTTRTMQSVADAVALDTANFLDGQHAADVDPTSPTGQTLAGYANSQAGSSAARNSFSPGGSNVLTVSLGTWSPGAGFVALPGGEGDTGTVPTAVHVVAQAKTKFIFGPGAGQSSRSATAVRDTNCPTCAPAIPTAGFTIGSYAASVDSSQSQLLNSLLGQTLGSGISLTALGYNGLGAANVTVADLLTANAGVGTLNSLLTTSFSPSTLLGYYANALGVEATAVLAQNPGLAAALQGAEATINSNIVPSITNTTSIQLCKVINLSGTSACSAGNTAPAAYTNLNALDFVRLVAEAANGNHLLTFNGGVGLGLITVTGNVISPIASAGPGPVGISATDQQAGITIGVNTGIVSVGVQVTAATATGTLNTITCGQTPQSTTTAIGVTATAATLTPTIAVDLLGISVPVPASTIQAGGTANPYSLSFTGPFNDQAPPSQSFGTTEPALTISPSGSVLGAVLSLLNPVLNLLNPLLSPLLSALGVNLGGGTVANHTVSCAGPVLVG